LSELESLLSANRTRRFEYAEILSKAGEETIQTVLDEWLLYWRDVVRASSSRIPSDTLADKLLNIDHTESIIRLADHVQTHSAVGMVRAITNTLRNVQQNASARLALDALLLRMPVVQV
jgi:hypothetical protein